MTKTLSYCVETIKAHGAVSADDVAGLRGQVFADGAVARSEVMQILEIHRSVNQRAEGWNDLVIDAIVDHALYGYGDGEVLTDEAAAALIALLAPHGAVASVVELEALCKVLESARSAPEALSVFALQQIKQGVLTGEGPTTQGRVHYSRVVDAADVSLLRRILWAPASCGGAAVTRAEAEVLFDIHDITATSANDPAFDDLFVKAVMHHVLGASGQQTPQRREALQRDPRLDEKTGVFNVFSAMHQAGFRGIFTTTAHTVRDWVSDPGSLTERAQAALNAEREMAEKAGSEINAEEAAWLATRILRDGRPTGAERALLKMISDNAPAIDPSLRALVDRAA